MDPLESVPRGRPGAAAAAAVTGAAVEADGAPTAGRGAGPLSRITASRTPTLAVTPSSTRISASTPEAGAGISVLTLSVSTSNSVSSALTASPTFLYQRVAGPPGTLSPRWGVVS